jgi:hypothetical protein
MLARRVAAVASTAPEDGSHTLNHTLNQPASAGTMEKSQMTFTTRQVGLEVNLWSHVW